MHHVCKLHVESCNHVLCHLRPSWELLDLAVFPDLERGSQTVGVMPLAPCCVHPGRRHNVHTNDYRGVAVVLQSGKVLLLDMWLLHILCAL